MDSQKAGFTLIEMIVVVALLAIIATVAVPGFGNLIEGNRLVSGSNLVVSSIRLARSEAIKRGSPITLSTTGTLEDGWCVHAGDATVNCDVANRIRLFESPDRLTYTATTTDLVFDRRGFLTPQTAQTLTIRPDNCEAGSDRLRVIRISPVGRTEIDTGVCP